MATDGGTPRAYKHVWFWKEQKDPGPGTNRRAEANKEKMARPCWGGRVLGPGRGSSRGGRGPVPAGLPDPQKQGQPVGSPDQSLHTQTHSPRLCQDLTLRKPPKRGQHTGEDRDRESPAPGRPGLPILGRSARRGCHHSNSNIGVCVCAHKCPTP